MDETTIQIRRAEHRDAEGMIRAHVRSIREVCAADYSAEQIAGWSGRDFLPEIWRRTIDEDFAWVVERGAQIAGFAHLAITDAGAVLRGLFLVPEVLGQGHGKRLLAQVVEVCRGQAADELRLESTRTARAFYRSQGFVEQGPCACVLGGVELEVFRMVRALR